jgi:RimJ/RimL family protein N-acetyltransferase
MEKIIETKRLYLRQFEKYDIKDLKEFLQDIQVMYAYEHAFTDEEVDNWFNNNRKRYDTLGFGLWAIIRKDTNEFLGDCGLTMQKVEDDDVLELGYHLKKKYWHNGYAMEAALACKDYAFNKIGAKKLYAIIRENNEASKHLAECLGMKVIKKFNKHYYGMDMLHYVYCVDR